MTMTLRLVLVAGVLAQVQGPPPRDARPAAQQVGTASISGRVLAADTGAPIRRAVVSLTSIPTAPGGTGTVSMQLVGPPGVPLSQASGRSTYTDDGGNFMFSELPAGRYMFVVNPGPTRAQYLSVPTIGVDPSIARRRFDLADGQKLEGADIMLPRAAVVTGRILDEAGEPIARAMVYGLQSRNGTMSRMGPGVTSDDLGQFRLFGLNPGDYVIAAESRAGGPPIAPGNNPGGQQELESLGFVTTYSPGTTNPSEAARLRIAAGQEATADIRMVRGRLYKISGSVVDSRGEPVTRANMQLTRRSAFGQMTGSSVQIVGPGRFTARDLAPGEYRITARSQAPGAAPGPPNPRAMTGEAASATIQIGQSDVDNVLLVLQPGASVTGTLVFDTPPATETRVRVMATPGERMSSMFGGEASAEVTGETFTLDNLFGPVLVRATAPTRGVALKAVLLRGKDITDVPTEFTAQDSGRLQVVMTSRAPTLEGTVAAADGEPVKDGAAVVLAFGEDPATWIWRTTMIRTTGVMPDGTFRLAGLREGNYLVIALPRDRMINMLEPSPEVLQALAKEATRVTLAMDETRKLPLRVAEGDAR